MTQQILEQNRELVARTKGEVLRASLNMYRSGLVAAVWGNVSARVPGTDLVVITPSGVDYETLTEDMLCVMDLNTEEVVEGSYKPSSERLLHLAVYRAREDVLGVMHTHSNYASAFSVAHKDIPPVVEDLAQVVGGSVTCSKYALPGTPDLGKNVVKALGKKGAVLLANHGVVGVGHTVDEAFRTCLIVEKGAQIHAFAKMIGNPVLLSLEDVEHLRHEYRHSYGQK
ncbi:L-fuculose-phosphate aldolase [Tumebacillus sp. BK434]|uniref:class II aldolase/adducin family protein n=1 Tax=Tumebacillus sp. BK434 TaxID=2512169 RepID=UPI0010504EBA|nr:class II aldolase/adducin family protein [Tumebacillus sp. BK434]TCP59275.1 L-fuculose-phosphate aldolase [Tumebacillus sp. BK434]